MFTVFTVLLSRLPTFHRVAIVITATIMVVTVLLDSPKETPVVVSTSTLVVEVTRPIQDVAFVSHDIYEIQAQWEKDFNSQKYRDTFICIGDPAVLRQALYVEPDMGEIRITTHRGKRYLNYSETRDTVVAVLSSLNNIPTTDDMVNLIIETFITETHFGKADFTSAAKRYANYGLGQLRLDTAKETLQWLIWINRRDVYDTIMSYYDESLSMEDNLMYNVPFSIAMTAEVYWRKLPDLASNIKTKIARAIVWKSVYNTQYGLGTVNKYLQRVDEFTATLASI